MCMDISVINALKGEKGVGPAKISREIWLTKAGTQLSELNNL